MKVLNLQCREGHGFEGWFASEEDYLTQKARHLLTCPVCGSAEVEKRLSAPHLNLGAYAAASRLKSEALDSEPSSARLDDEQGRQAAMLQSLRQMAESTEDVGDRFVEEARSIHYGESPERGIRGRATAKEAADLVDEGIEVLPIPLPQAFRRKLQ